MMLLVQDWPRPYPSLPAETRKTNVDTVMVEFSQVLQVVAMEAAHESEVSLPLACLKLLSSQGSLRVFTWKPNMRRVIIHHRREPGPKQNLMKEGQQGRGPWPKPNRRRAVHQGRVCSDQRLRRQGYHLKRIAGGSWIRAMALVGEMTMRILRKWVECIGLRPGPRT